MISNQVDIYDPLLGAVSTYQLPDTIQDIRVAGSGSKVLFAGLSVDYQRFIYYVLNMESSNVTTVTTRWRFHLTGSVVVGSKAYLFGPVSLSSFDMETYNITDISLPEEGPINNAVTDGAVIYVLFNQQKIFRYDPQFSTWSSYRNFTENYITLLYNSRRRSLIAYGTDAMLVMTIGANLDRTYRFPELRTRSLILPIMDGDFIFVADQRTMIVHDTQQLASFRYRMSAAMYSRSFSAVAHDGVIYYTGSGTQTISVLTVNTAAFFQPIPVPASSQSIFARGIFFWFLQSSSQLMTYSLDLHESTVIPWSRPRLITAHELVSSKLLMIGDAAYDIYNFDTNELISRNLPDLVPEINILWRHASGDYAAFILNNALPRVALLYDGANDVWTTIRLNDSRRYQRVHVVNDKVIFISGRNPAYLEVYDINSSQWVGFLELGDVFLPDIAWTSVGNMFFFSGSRAIDSRMTVHMYDTSNDTFRTKILPGTRNGMRISGMNDEWAVFRGGMNEVGILSARVDFYNVHRDIWTSAELPPVPPENRIILFTNFENFAFFGRSTRVDILDLNRLDVSAVEIPHTFSGLNSMMPMGSKIICIGWAANIEIAFYEISTQMVQSIELHGSYIFSEAQTWRNLFHFTYGNAKYAMPLSAMFAIMESRETFAGLTTNLTVAAQGLSLNFSWRHNGRPLNATDQILTIPSAQRSSEGLYQVQIIDQCSARMVQHARLTVHGPPVITLPLQNTILLCHQTQNMTTNAEGKEIELSWTIGNNVQVTPVPSILTIANDSLACNSVNDICVTASNPAGSINSCAKVRFLDINNIFEGPYPTHESKLYFPGANTELHIAIKQDWCIYHEWFADGNKLVSVEGSSSSIGVQVTRGIEKTRFYVIAHCGNSVIQSEPFVFKDISPLEVWAVALIVVLGVLVITAAIVIAIVMARRLNQSAQNEMELQEMLSKAKTESLKKDATPIIKVTTWQWTPTDDFTYKSLDSFPFTVDTSRLKFGDSNNPLEVDMVSQSDMIFTLNATKSKKHLKRPLLNGLTVDLYAPTSPKYEITIEPSSFELAPNSSVHVAVSAKLRMTTKCKVTLIVVLEQQRIYSAIEFRLASQMSTWIDLEEIETGEYLGGGG